MNITKNELQKILKLGGMTCDYHGKKIDYKRGYQISIKDLAIFDITQKTKILNFTKNLQLAKNEFLGFWVDNNKIYIDISKHYNNKNKAITEGKKNNQISIFDWYKKDCIYLNK